MRVGGDREEVWVSPHQYRKLHVTVLQTKAQKCDHVKGSLPALVTCSNTASKMIPTSCMWALV